MALNMLQAITNRDIRETISRRIDSLVTDPDKQGKALGGALRGFRSLYVYQERYRVLYRVDRGLVQVMVVAVGIRKEGDRQDIYALAQKLLRSGLLGAP
jgi:mRNA interferase RelE/StbE